MDFTKIFDIFAEYGWSGVILIIIVGLIYYLVKSNNKDINSNIKVGMDNLCNKITDQMNAQNNVLVKTLSDTQTKMLEQQTELLSRIFSNKDFEHDKQLNHRLAVSGLVDEKLKELINIYHARRAYILEFHNSKENFNGLPFVWYDIVNEYGQRGIPSIKFNNAPISNIFPVIEDLCKSNNPGWVLYKADDLENLYDRSSVLYNSLVKKQECKGIIYFPLYREGDSRIIAILAIEKGDEISEDLLDCEAIKQDAMYIETLLRTKK